MIAKMEPKPKRETKQAATKYEQIEPKRVKLIWVRRRVEFIDLDYLEKYSQPY